MATRNEVYAAIDSEREYQDRKGVHASKAPHEHGIESFIVYMEDYLAEARKQASRIWTEDGRAAPVVLDTIRKVTALGVACMEQHGAPSR